MVEGETALSHHLFQIPIAEGVAQIPAHTEEDNLSVIMMPFERSGFRHGNPQRLKIRASVSYLRATGLFLQQSLISRLFTSFLLNTKAIFSN